MINMQKNAKKINKGALPDNPYASGKTVLEHTKSLCPICLKRIPAVYAEEEGNVYLEKTCPEHGFYSVLVWENSPEAGSYQSWLRPTDNNRPAVFLKESRLGCPYDCGLCPEHEQAACCVALDITEECNLNCPICFADSGPENISVEESLEQIRLRYSALARENREHPYNIQLSGGEPTTREDIAEIIAMGKSYKFPYIQLNTNGLRLAESLSFTRSLKRARLDSVFLQFDSLKNSSYKIIRGRPLLAIKKKAIENCRKALLPVTLVMTVVPGVNTEEIGEVLNFALENSDTVRGVHFQPLSFMGRTLEAPDKAGRITLSALIQAIERQSGGIFKGEHFKPITSGHCLCSFYGDYILEGGKIIPAENQGDCCRSNRESIYRVRDYIARKWSKKDNPDTPWDKAAAALGSKSFSLTAMAFMDIVNLDINRLKKCRVHIDTKTGRIPLCAYNVTSLKGERLYARL